MKSRFTVFCVACVCAFVSCTEDTGLLGVTDSSDVINTSTDFYNIYTETVALDSVQANSLTFFLGQLSDTIREEPLLVSDMNASFATQLYVQEGFSFPNQSYITSLDSNSVVTCDSVILDFFFDEWYGENDNPLKVSVYPLSKTMEEDSTYYTCTDFFRNYVDASSPLVTKMVTPKDYINTSATYSYIKLPLDNSFGQKIMQKYYSNISATTGKNPDFQNSYYFNHNVFPGFYVTSTAGMQSMYKFYTGSLYLYYRYKAPTDTAEYSAVATFASTPEVLQKTQFSDDLEDIYDKVKDDTCTYLKSPAGLATRVTIPVDEIYAGSHSTDSITRLQLSLTRYNKDQSSSSTYVPTYVVMVRERDMKTFFANHSIPDSQTSYLATINENYNTYTFSNICRLVSYLRSEKTKAMKEENITSEEYNAKHPDWNRVIVVPTEIGYDASNNVTSCTHDLSLESARLVGGKTHPIKVQVYYAKFNIEE